MFPKPKNPKLSSRLTIIFLLIILTLVLSFLINYFFQSANQRAVVIAEQKFNIELAKTAKEKTIGLSQRKKLPEKNGLLFVYERSLIPTFWMKDMKFPIDIIWIKDDMVVGYEKNLNPVAGEVDLPIYQPRAFVNYVLEINAGLVEKYGIRVGDKVDFDI
ncbi:MAG: hypothetical protein A3B89_01265 [Candidatus Buchananbacteria bacterium RIFCSPHIGHO2_02_FULL_40_13]|uniref:DUF192 domain-containing protein n=1 Tax=Candidatus Buchananbacteria bacterium RIFCSPLOWO2_01_FULL_39_33 TaxID=1797543 RepID=A0A1G1YLG4_9BACT|nr:MAG: hypothetical protein A2820_03420 [Candidatus Buchananbacteria bacterium RIFCSPHIGHO2_01_FULL_40_35]OGY50119.1 MAG: hypothetical protein A3B89_01265 [Candidatus Buchananbacteria bacterium RIFCSPHIGHO2_02_FULL_40_13]OGY53101.1 MAG: hypothetical protein A3A02_00080 [Candidatus Buchananbacteria bacterium RIFCSPLOWO2_01_FULL_39_33]